MVGHLPLLFSSLEENHHRQPRSQLHRFYVKPHIRINISENCETNHTRISPIRCCMRLHMPPKDSALWHTSHGLTRAANKSMHGHAIKRVLHMLDTEVFVMYGKLWEGLWEAWFCVQSNLWPNLITWKCYSFKWVILWDLVHGAEAWTCF